MACGGCIKIRQVLLRGVRFIPALRPPRPPRPEPTNRVSVRKVEQPERK